MTLSGEQLQRHARDTALALPNVSRGYPFTAHLEVWKVHQKVFMIITEDDPDLQIITVKTDPHHGDALRRDIEAITSGRYFNKQHWISIGAGDGINTALISDLVHDSYDLANDHQKKRQP